MRRLIIPSTEIVTVLSHLATGECWGMEGKAEGGEENVAQEKVAETLQSDWALHQSGGGEEDNKEKKGAGGQTGEKWQQKGLGQRRSIPGSYTIPSTGYVRLHDGIQSHL